MHTDARLLAVDQTVGDPGPESPSDEALVELAVSGSAAALSQLLGRHQRYVFNVALRFLQSRPDAEDATQEILLRLATRLASFRNEGPFRSWARRVAMNHLLDRARSRAERGVKSFECYAEYLARAADSAKYDPERSALVEEAKLTCTLGMLLCFDRRQRLAFILGEIFEVSDREGAELLGVTPDNFRQLLGRARAQLSSFVRNRCGLVDPRNPCRCSHKTRAFVRDGIVEPERLTFLPQIVAEARRLSARVAADLDASALPAPARALSIGELLRAQPYFDSPDVAARVMSLLSWPRPGDGSGASPPEAS
jgi:RNA polymerase sigma factor (sigma-70 family)